MDFITKIFDLDFAALMPELPVFMGIVRTLLVLGVLAGPVILLVMGALYLFKPAPEANYRYGFRTYFGMGSIEAWRFSQKIAGLTFGALGAVLLIIMLIVVLCFGGKDLMQVARASMISLFWQVGLILLARLVPAILSGVFFDKNGNRRR